MKGKIITKIISAMICTMLLVGNVLPAKAAEPFEDIGNAKPSKTDYVVELSDVANTFIGNKTPVEMTEGKRFYLVYTVAEVTYNDLWQNGLVVTADNTKQYVYLNGTMHYNVSKDKLFEVGSTYFCRYEMTEEGLSYVAAKVNKDGEASYIEMATPYGENYKGNKYFGLWLGSNGGRMTAKLSQVLCYDENGKDLGIHVNTPSGGASVMNYDLLTELNVPHSYEFSVKDVTEFAICNARETKDETVFMSYTVKNVEKNSCSQTGGFCTTTPTRQFPYTGGIMNYTYCKEDQGSSLLHEGSHYLIRFDRNGGDLKVSVKETTAKGQINYLGFPILYGTYQPEAEYFGLWFGESASRMVTADFVDFKCYDSRGKNLAVQFNKTGINARHIGNLEDYSLCDGVYYALANDTFLILDDECNMGRRVDEEGQDTAWGTYVVNEDKLILTMDKTNEEFTYLYDYMTDKEGNKYIRLSEQSVTFVTGDKDSDLNKTVTVTAADGYKVEEPEKPSFNGLTFKEWCLGDGTAYDFDSVVTETMTLYAKYVDGDGQEYLLIEEPVSGVPVTAVVAVVTSVLLVVVTVVTCILVIRRQKRYEK